LGKAGAKLLLATFFDSPEPWLTEISQLPVQGFHFDLVSGPAALSWIKTRSFPKDKILSLGLLNSLNVWAAPLASVFKQVELLKGFHPPSKLLLAPSAPLSFLPLSTENEESLNQYPILMKNLSFADQRLLELKKLKAALTGQTGIEELEKNEAQLRKELSELHKPNGTVRGNVQKIDLHYRRRLSSWAKRSKIQTKRLGLPKLPLTLTSFGQEQRGRPIESLIAWQEQYQLDVLLPDTQNFDERLNQWAPTSGGFFKLEKSWIPLSAQERFKPLILFGDIEWKPWESAKRAQEAQVLTNRMVKGVVTGPVSTLNHSFIRQDLSWEAILLQCALWIRSEIKSFENAGIRMIQVDEPFLLDRLPLKKNKRTLFLKGIFDPLKVALCGAGEETFVHLNLATNEVESVKEVCGKCDVD